YRIQDLQAEAATHRFTESQLEAGVERLARPLTTLGEQLVHLFQLALEPFTLAGLSVAQLTTEAELELAETRGQFTQVAFGRLHRGQLLIELQVEGGALAARLRRLLGSGCLLALALYRLLALHRAPRLWIKRGDDGQLGIDLDHQCLSLQ